MPEAGEETVLVKVLVSLRCGFADWMSVGSGACEHSAQRCTIISFLLFGKTILSVLMKLVEEASPEEER